MRKWREALKLWWKEDLEGMKRGLIFRTVVALVVMGILITLTVAAKDPFGRILGIFLTATAGIVNLVVLPIGEALQRIERREKEQAAKEAARARRERLAQLTSETLGADIDPSSVDITSDKVTFSLIRISQDGLGEGTLLVANDELVVGQLISPPK